MNFRLILVAFFLMPGMVSMAQRNYTANSVLANGSWFKIAVDKQGVYKIDAGFLAKLGVNTGGLSSSAIRLFGNGGAMLPEDNQASRYDDLKETALTIVDGGDGIFNGNDYLLFYAPGPDRWLYDSLQQTFQFQQNIFSRQSFYFLSVSGLGKRVATAPATSNVNALFPNYDFLYAHEQDTINFLRSGKQWYGEEFSNTPGNVVNRTLTINVQQPELSNPVQVATQVVARSVGAASQFQIAVNGQLLPPLDLPAVSGNFLQPFATEAQQNINVQLPVAGNNLSVSYVYKPSAFNAQGWLNWLIIRVKAALLMPASGQFTFRNVAAAGVGRAGFSLKNTNNGTRVWRVTDHLSPVEIQTTIAANELLFNDAGGRLNEYIAFTDAGLMLPQAIGQVANQNLHNITQADLIIIAHPTLQAQAQRLANFRSAKGLKVLVATTTQVFNEFASGTPDATAMRDFVKMLYDRAGTDSAAQPHYLLLFGDASFDYKNRIAQNTNLVPAYQSNNSLDPLQTYTSDDFFGFLDDEDDINSGTPLLDISIGRIPAKNAEEAKIMVDKIIHYSEAASLGPWRNLLTFVADDEDVNLHLQDAEYLSGNVSAVNNQLSQTKIYLDAFKQESGSGGSRYPVVNEAITGNIFGGTLLWNYSGHGGSQRLADEAILDRNAISKFNNADRLPIFVTATCDFAPYDDPAIQSLGEDLLMAGPGGGIALTTTTRLVFASSNRIINNNFLQALLSPSANNTYPLLGDALRQAKNTTYLQGDIINNRKFTLLGDPALEPALPKGSISVTHINGNTVTGSDTLKALGKYTIAGEIFNATGQVQTDFNGTINLILYGPQQVVQTLANDAGSNATTFTQQNNSINRGKATVQSGKFSLTFVVPKNISYTAENGKLSLYAENGQNDAGSIYNNVIIGGAGGGNITDNEGPTINAFLNDEKFVNGGLVNETPVLLLKLADSSGINTASGTIGHDITATVDGNEKDILVLNEFYEAELNSYQQGTVRFPLSTIENGNHSLKIKAWDVANNSTETILDFVVAKQEDLKISHVFNYPNPFTSRTNFWFEHNQPASNLKVLIQIFSLSGKLVHQIQRIINTPGNRSIDIEWNGRDTYSEKLARGVYVYKLLVTAPNGKQVQTTEKLYLL